MRITNDFGVYYTMNVTFNCNIRGINTKEKHKEHYIKSISNIKNKNLCFGSITHCLRNIDYLYTGNIMLHFSVDENRRDQYCFFDIETIKFYLNEIYKIVKFEYTLEESKTYSRYYNLRIKIKDLNKFQIYFILNMTRRLYNHPQAEFLQQAIAISKETDYNLFDLLLIGDRLDSVTHPDNLLYVYDVARKPIRVKSKTLKTPKNFSLAATLTSKHYIKKETVLEGQRFKSKHQHTYIINSKQYKVALKDINEILRLMYKSIRNVD